MARRGFVLLLLLAGLLTLPRTAQAEDGLEAARRAFLRGRDAERLLSALERAVPPPPKELLQLARLAVGREASAGGEDALAPLARVAAALRAGNLDAARVAASAAPRAAPTAWAGALVHLRRGDDAGAVGSLLAPPLFDWEADAFRVALFAAALPPEDRDMLSAGAGVALERSAARGRVAALRSTALGLAALGPRAGMAAFVRCMRALRRSDHLEEARALLALAPTAGIERGDPKLALESALTAWAGGETEQVPTLLAGLSPPAGAQRVFLALRNAGRRGRVIDTGGALRHVKGGTAHAFLLARLATVLGSATRRTTVETWSREHKLDLDEASTGTRFLQSRGLRVLPVAGESGAVDALLAAGLPVLLYRLQRVGRDYQEVPALVRGFDRRTGLWLLDQPDMERLDVVPRTVAAKARLLCVVPAARGTLLTPFETTAGAQRGARIEAALEAFARASPEVRKAGAAAQRLKAVSTDAPVENLYLAWLQRRVAAAAKDDKLLRSARAASDRSRRTPPLLAFEVYLQAEGMLADGDRDGALAALQRVNLLEGPSASLSIARFALHDMKHEHQRAREAMDEAIALAPLDSRLMTLRGGLRAKAGDPDGARRDLRRALDRQPDALLIAVALSRLEVDGGRPDVALDVLQDTERRDPSLKDDPNLAAARLAAERALISGAETVEALSRARRSRSPEARRLLAYALSERVSEAEAAEGLLRGLLGDEDAAVRTTTLRLYMRPWLRERVGADPVLGRRIAHIMAKDADPNVRAAAAALLGRVGTSLCGTSLTECLAGPNRDPSIRVRGAAARALASHEDAAAHAALVEALLDPALSVRRAAIDGLFRIAATTHGFEPDGPPAKRAEALELWRQWLAEQKK